MDQITQLLNRHPWTEHVFSRIFHVLVLLIVIFICMKLIRMLCRQILTATKQNQGTALFMREREKRITTIVTLIQTTLIVVLFVIAVLMSLRDFGLDITPLLTGAGIVGVAIGLGAQGLVKDLIAGFFLLVENQIRIGDFVKISGLSGTVEKMELRITSIRDDDGTLHIIPNGEIKSVSNMTCDFATAVVNIPIPYQIDLKIIYTLLEAVVSKFESDNHWKTMLQGRVHIVGITAFTNSGMMIQLTVKTDPHARGPVAIELRRQIKLGLENMGIKLIPPISLSHEERQLMS